MHPDDFILYTRREYFKQLATDIGKTQTGERVAIATMSYDPAEPLIAELMQALSRAAARGVHVTLIVDAYAFLVNEVTKIPGPLWLNSNIHGGMWQPFKDRLAALESLKKHGGKYTITNMPKHAFSAIPTGRSHIKGAVINDVAYVGGCNLRSPEEIDVMIARQDLKTADWLYATLCTMAEHGGSKHAFKDQDQAFALGDAAAILIDAGKPHQSTIYDHALQLIDEAEERIFLTCQFFPGGVTAKHLLAAHKRGVAVTIYYSPPTVHGKEAPAHYAYNLRERTKLPADFFKHQLPHSAPRMHAKVLITEKAAMVGSHNYVTQGVNFGTAEIALLWQNAEFGQVLHKHITQQLVHYIN